MHCAAHDTVACEAHAPDTSQTHAAGVQSESDCGANLTVQQLCSDRVREAHIVPGDAQLSCAAQQRFLQHRKSGITSL